MKRVIAAWIVVGISALAGAACLLAPVPSNPTYTAFSFYMFLVVTAMIAVLYVGASVIFLTSLKGFTKRLQRAYASLCAAFILLGLAFIQLPLLVYGGGVEDLFKGGSYSAGLFLLALVAIGLSTRAFARLFGVNGLITKYWFIFIPPIILAVLYAWLPHTSTQTDELKFDINNGFNVLNAWIDCLALLMILKVKKVAGIQYTKALAWLTIFFSIQLFAVVGYLSAVLPFGDQQWFLVGVAPIFPLFFAGMTLVRSAYSFSTITSADQGENLTVTTARNFFGTPLDGSTVDDQASSIDIVVYAANLVSQPQQIDPLLEDIRTITSNVSDAGLSETDQSSLQKTYLAIEDYLVTKEPVRTFTKESLRQTIADDLKLTDTPNTFWNRLVTN